jgi:hypothetical protein
MKSVGAIYQIKVSVNGGWCRNGVSGLMQVQKVLRLHNGTALFFFGKNGTDSAFIGVNA